jgi:hypothetical protein
MILLGMLSVLVACNMYLVNLISEDGSKVQKRRSLLVSLLLSLKLRRKSSPARPYRKILLIKLRSELEPKLWFAIGKAFDTEDLTVTASRSRVSSDADGIPQSAELDLGQKQRGSSTRVRLADSLLHRPWRTEQGLFEVLRRWAHQWHN